MHESQGRPDEALESYKRAAEADPTDAEAHVAAGAVHESQGRAAEADPSSVEAHVAAGRVHMSQGRAAEALESYKRAAEADPMDAEGDMEAGALGKGQGGTAGPGPGRSAPADPAGAKELAGRARDRLLKRRGWLRDADDMTRHIKHSRRRQSDDRR